MKHITFICILFAMLLSACGSSQPAPTANATATSLPTNTLIPTSTETPTPSIPMIDVDGVKVPDPKVSNPELFDLTNPDSPIVQFANAFGIKPEEVGELTPVAKTSIDGKQFIILTTSDLAITTDFDESGTPLIIAERQSNEEWGWSKVTLKKLGKKLGMPIGTYIDFQVDRTHDIVSEEFSIYLNESIGAWQYREKKQGELNFEWSDQQLQFAKKNDMITIGQHLVHTESLPDWVKKGGFSNEQLTNILKEHIQSTMSHYPDVKIWSVVNEAWFYNGYYNGDDGKDFWYQNLGKDYIKIAFETARKENPSAILCYSDYANERQEGPRANMNHEIVQMLKAEGLIDGLMMHMRINAADPPTKENLISTMRSYELPIYITELTVDLSNVNGAQQERFLTQAKVYKSIMEAAIESGTTESFVMFGIGNDPDWLDDPTIFHDNDGSFERKPAYYALLSALTNGESK